MPMAHDQASVNSKGCRHVTFACGLPGVLAGQACDDALAASPIHT